MNKSKGGTKMVNAYVKNYYSNESLKGSYLKLGLKDTATNQYIQIFIEVQENVEALTKEIQQVMDNHASKDFFIAPVVYKEKEGKKGSLSYVTALYADFDTFKGDSLKNMDEESAAKSKKDMIDILKKLDFKPSEIVSSGNGLHVYWRLEKPLQINDNIQMIEAALKALAKLPCDFSGDIAATTLGHTLRLPGTFNRKDKNNHKVCETIFRDEANFYNFEDICKTLKINVAKDFNKGESSMFDRAADLKFTLNDIKSVAKKCEFIVYLAENPDMQDYSHWFALAQNLAVFGENGRILFHKISEKYEDYESAESEKLFNSALKGIKDHSYFPVSCETLNNYGYECSKTCSQKSPAGMMLNKLINQEAPASEKEKDIEEAIKVLIPKINKVANLELIEQFIKEVLNPAKKSVIVKEAFLKEAMKALKIPERGNFSTLKKLIAQETVESENPKVLIGDEIIKEKDVAYIGGAPYYYENGVWRAFETGIESIIIKKSGDDYSKAFAEDILYYIKNTSEISISKANNNKEKGLICMKNGMLEISDGGYKLLPFDKKYYALSQLSMEYDENASCPMWEEFLEESFALLAPEDREKTIENLQEWFGYSMVSGNEFQKMLFIIGESRTGKGVLLDVYGAFLGEEHISAIPIGSINNEFNAINLMNKLANIGPEIGQFEKFNEAFVKSVVGEDYVSGRFLHKNLVRFKNPAKLVFATNHVPNILDSSEAMYERALCISMDRVVEPGKRDPFLKTKLRGELPGIMNWALEGRKRLFQRGRFDESNSMISLKKRVKAKNNRAEIWLESRPEIFDTSKKYISLKECWEEYQEFCGAENTKPGTRTNFKMHLEKIPGIQIKKLSKPNQECVFFDNDKILPKAASTIEKQADARGEVKNEDNPKGQEEVKKEDSSSRILVQIQALVREVIKAQESGTSYF